MMKKAASVPAGTNPGGKANDLAANLGNGGMIENTNNDQKGPDQEEDNPYAKEQLGESAFEKIEVPEVGDGANDEGNPYNNYMDKVM